jgi:hypothetical protein
MGCHHLPDSENSTHYPLSWDLQNSTGWRPSLDLEKTMGCHHLPDSENSTGCPLS